MNSGSTSKVSRVRPQLSRSMIVSGDDELHGVLHDVAERGGDRLLRADHVVVEAGLESAGL